MTTSRMAALIAAITVTCLPPVRFASAQTTYQIRDLGTLGGNASIAYHVNDDGVVVGTTSVSGASNSGFVWCTTPKYRTCDGRMHPVALFKGARGTARWVNEAGLIAGSSQATASDTATHPMIYDLATAVGKDLGLPKEVFTPSRGATFPAPRFPDLQPFLTGRGDSEALAVNSHGRVVGEAIGPTTFSEPFVYPPMAGIVKGAPSDTLAMLGLAENDHDLIVGAALDDLFGLTMRAFRWDGAQWVPLGAMAGKNSVLSAANNLGLMTGRSSIAGSQELHAATFDGTRWTDLGTLGGPIAQGYALNEAGDVVGASTLDATHPDTHAFIVRHGGAIEDLNRSLPAGSKWTLEAGLGINAHGAVVGMGTINGKRHAFLMTPVKMSQGAGRDPNAWWLVRALLQYGSVTFTSVANVTTSNTLSAVSLRGCALRFHHRENTRIESDPKAGSFDEEVSIDLSLVDAHKITVGHLAGEPPSGKSYVVVRSAGNAQAVTSVRATGATFPNSTLFWVRTGSVAERIATTLGRYSVRCQPRSARLP